MNPWKIWALSLGPKASDDKLIADVVALVRTAMFSSVFITNLIICAGVIWHWNQ